METNNKPLLEMENFHVYFRDRKKRLPAVSGVSMTIHPSEIVGVVGESGSGKSVMSQSILRLREYEADVEYEGRVVFEGQEILKLPLAQMQNIRGNRISVIFQDPLTSLNPVLTVGRQMEEVLFLHKKMSRQDARARSIELLRLTGVPYPERCVKQYPYELSGGMQQRVMISMALACEPSLLIADEPTTALDVTIQNQILRLLSELNQKLGMAILLITHDLSVMAQICHSVRVMYLGQIVEEAKTEELFDNPMHPYTQGLLDCIPHLDVDREKPLHVITGTVPPLSQIPVGCHFCTRCPYATEQCRSSEPPAVETAPGHKVKCWNPRVGNEKKREESAI